MQEVQKMMVVEEAVRQLPCIKDLQIESTDGYTDRPVWRDEISRCLLAS